MTRIYETYRPTRYAGLGYVKDGPRLWRLLDVQQAKPDGLYARVGPQYTSQAELLADLHRYATETWGA